MKLGGTLRAIQKMTQNDNGPGPSRNYEETAFLRSAKKCFFGKKAFYQKKHPKFLKRLIFILERGTFFFEQPLPVVARTWLGRFWKEKKTVDASKSLPPPHCEGTDCQ